MNIFKEKSNTKVILLSLFIISAFAILFTFAFLKINNFDKNTIHAADPASSSELASKSNGNNSANNFKIRVNYNDLKAPKNSVSPQYAAEKGNTIAQNVFSKKTTGRVAVELEEPDDNIYGKYPAWVVLAEVEDGYIETYINAVNGLDIHADFYKGKDNLNNFLYSWKNAKDNADKPPVYAENFSEKPVNEKMSKDAKEEIKVKRKLVEKFIEQKKSLPHNDKALKIVNDTNLGNNTKAKRAQAVMSDGDEGNETLYLVEVQMQNGTSIILNISAKKQEFQGYTRYKTNFLNTNYPIVK